MRDDTLEWLVEQKKKAQPVAVDAAFALTEIEDEREYMNLLDKEKNQEKFVTLTMRQGFYVSSNGYQTAYHKRGEVIEVPETVAEGLIRDEVAVPGKVDEKRLEQPVKADSTLKKLDPSVARPVAPRVDQPDWNEQKPFAANEPDPADPLNFDERGPKDIRDDKRDDGRPSKDKEKK